MRLTVGAGLVVLGLVVYGPVLTALTLPRATAHPASTPPPSADVDREAAPSLDDLQDAWRARIGGTYRDAEIVLGDDATGTGYEARAERVVIDRGFLDELATVYGASSRGAQVYAVAHAMGHHVARQLAVTGDARSLELVADCLAGVWAREAGALDAREARSAVAEAASVASSRRARLGRAFASSLEPSLDLATDERVEALLAGLATSDLAACDQSGSAEGSPRIAPVNRVRR